MRIPVTVYTSLNCFYNSLFSSIPEVGKVSYSSHSILARYHNGRITIPVLYCKYLIREFLKGSIPLDRDIVMPLPSKGVIQAKTSASILSKLPTGVPHYTQVLRIETGRDYYYYGSTGLILDQRFRPMMLCAYEVVADSGIDKLMIRPVCLISPRIYESEDMLSKYIASKVIPAYSNMEITSIPKFGKSLDIYNPSIKIVISSEIDDFIQSTVAPDRIDIEDSLFDELRENIHLIKG